ncbi:MAG TPA: hypothetical protein VML56_00335 [Burkholderiales bacterium]|nr:hypothetical protein [Burkholderiales bacterium]
MAGEVTARLQQLGRRIEYWRLTRRKRGPMPAELWDEAVALAQSLGVCPVSRALRIGYESLQQRVAMAPGPGRRPSPGGAGSGFLELSGAELVGMAPPDSVATVEVVAADGARLTIRCSRSIAVDVAAVVESFRRRT